MATKTTKRKYSNEDVAENETEKDSSLPALPDYDPLIFLRCLSNKTGQQAFLDDDTKIWKCVFQPSPDPEKQGETTNLVAACGENTICIIDCKSGQSILRYQEAATNKKNQETFYAIAWTSLKFNRDDGQECQEKTNILVAAGRLGRLYFIDINARVSYHTIKISKKGISCLVFHPQNPQLLLSGSEEKIVSCWDIGVPSVPSYTVESTAIFSVSASSNVLNLAVFPRHDLLVASTEASCLAWHVPVKDLKHGMQISPSDAVRVMCPEETKDVVDENLMVDGLAVISDDICATKYSRYKCIYLWKVSGVLRTSKGYYKFSPVSRLAWCPTGEIYINAYSHPCSGLMVTGDEQGRLWLYNVKEFLDINTLPTNRTKAFVSRILVWPECVIDGSVVDHNTSRRAIIVNTVATSSDSQYIVAGTDNNIVCIWKMETK